MNRLLQLLVKSLRMSKSINVKATMALAIMAMAGGTAWGQIEDGLYYIKVTDKNGTKEDYVWRAISEKSSGQPYLSGLQQNTAYTDPTTGDVYDATNCLWIVKQITSGANTYYTFINVATNQYVVWDHYTNGTGKAVHLETRTIEPTQSSDHCFFTYSSSGNNHFIHPDLCPTMNCGFNYKGDFKDTDQLRARDNDGRGLIQFYNGTTNTITPAPLLPAPTINYDSEANTFTITYDKIPAGFDILYTTDGTDPTVGGSTTQTYSSTVTVTGTYTLKTVVARYGIVLTRVATQGVGIPSNPVISSTADCSNTVEITGDGTIYYTTDGTDPDNTCAPYAEPFAMNEDATIKAIAYNGTLHSDISTLNYTPQYTAKPVISQSGITITITGSGTIYYTTDGSDPTTASTPYTAPITLSDGSGTMTIKAAAKESTKGLSCIAETTISLGYFINDLSKLQGISSHLAERCIVTNDFDARSLDASISGFTGELDGGYHTISGLTVPLFDNLSGGTVKNVIFSSVNISDASHAGAVTNVASGSTRIYNCGVLSGSVTSTGGNAGGLVGQIAAGSSVRVVNCYNYATISGSDYAGGIVGKNEGSVGDVRIALCMMYGNMTTGTNRSPVYGGNHTSNSQNYTEYNFWRSKANLTYTAYNDQLAIDKDEYLTRFPFYRHILNTHRELAAFFLFGGTGETVNDITADEIAEIGHWVLKKNVANYPIVEEWQTNTRKVLDAPAGSLVNDDNLSTSLRVTVKIDDDNYNVTLPITDMDVSNYDYTWGKVVLPFANEFKVNDDYSRICTGWKITSITGGNGATFEKYNYANRNCTDKDLYSESKYVFAQGGNYIVPYGVTAITIEANFANAYYLSDPAYEIGLNNSYSGTTNLGGTVPSTYHGQPVATNLKTLLGAMPAAANPHVQAIVLVGNYHFNDGGLGNYGNAFTLMSIDADNNQEPDYGFYTYNSTDRPGAPSMRFDFLPVIPVGMAAHVNGSTGFPGVPIWKVRGWFEITETCVFYTSQCEIDSGNFNSDDDGKGNNRWIVNSGYFVQIVRSRATNCSKVSYIQMGGNVFVEEFYPGSHSDNDKTTTLVPVNVTGGEIKECFMTGYSSQTNAKASGDNIYFWCAGGKIHKFLGAYIETPTPKTSGSKVNMTANIDHAIIGRYFGGGTSAKASIGGNITTTINNSKVDFFCGGPEFSSATETPMVETNATNTTFGEYYGAGFGGTSITYARVKQENSVNISNDKEYPIGFSDVYKRLNKTSDGIGTCYKFEYIYHSYDRVAVARSYTGYAQFSLATTGNVTNLLTYCKIKKLAASETIFEEETTGDFYGAGCQGKVDGTVGSTLMNCEVDGSAYGGGFKAESNEVSVYPATPPTYSVYKKEMALFTDFGEFPTPQTFKWKPGDVGANDSKQELYTGITQEQMNELGNVTGDISITIGGDSKIGTDGDSTTGSVYGGGNESKSLGNTTVTLKGNTEVLGDVFGGGNRGLVEGSATVNITE